MSTLTAKDLKRGYYIQLSNGQFKKNNSQQRFEFMPDNRTMVAAKPRR